MLLRYFCLFISYFLLRSWLVISKRVDSRYEIYLEIALVINKMLYDDEDISYQIYKMTEDRLIHKMKMLKSSVL